MIDVESNFEPLVVQFKRSSIMVKGSKNMTKFRFT